MELRDYLNVLRARRGTIILATLVVAGVALASSLLQAPVYEAEAKILIAEQDAGAALLGTSFNAYSNQPERALATQVQLMRTRPIAEATIKKLNLTMTPDSLLSRLEVSSVSQTNIITIRASASSPKEAADIANMMASEYVESSRERKRESLTQAATEVEQRLETAKNEVLALGRRLTDASKDEDSKVDQDMQAEFQIAVGMYQTLAEQLEQMRISQRLESGSGSLVQPAVPNNGAVSPEPLRDTLLGLVVGLAFGVALAFLYDYLDSTIKSTEEAERVYGAPVLGTIPVDTFHKGVARRLALTQAPGSSTAEAYRVLRNSLDFINFEHDLRALLITSAAPAEGKSTVAANLAAALAQAGKRVVLISVDFRRPTTEQFFDVNNMIGLSDVLLGTHSLKSALQRSGDDQLLILTSGKMPPNPSELLGSSKMEEVIASLKEWGDWVIVDAPPLLAVADPAATARWTDAVLMVSKAGESTRDNARKAAELLAKVGAKIAGVVIWGLDEGKGGQGYGYYAGGYYYYHSYYGAPEKGRSAEGGEIESKAKRFGQALGRVVTAVLSFLAVVVILAVVLYLLDGYFGWGLVESLRALFT